MQNQFYRKNQKQSQSLADLKSMNEMVENPNDTFGLETEGDALNQTAFNMQKSIDRKMRSS